MMFVALTESLFPIGIALFLLTTVTLGGGLLLTRLLRKRLDAATETLLLRATFVATLAGILLAFVPLPRPNIMPTAPTEKVHSETVRDSGNSPVPAVPASPVGRTPVPAASPLPTLALPALLVSVWLATAALLIGRLLAGYGYIDRLEKGTSLISPNSEAGSFYWKAFASAQRRPAKIVRIESADLFLVDLPFLPTFLVLPHDADTRFDRPVLEAILAHERSHLERRDGWWNLAAHTLCCLLWFQPLTWILLRAQERNSETASDETALAHSACTARDYAEMLIRFAESPQRGQHPLLQSLRGITPLLSRTSLEERIRSLMNRSSQPTNRSAPPRLRAIMFGSLILLTSAGVATFGVRSNAAPVQPLSPVARPVTTAQQPPMVTLSVKDAHQVDILKQMLRQVGMRIAEGDEKLIPTKHTLTMNMNMPLPAALRTFFQSLSRLGDRDTWYQYEIKGKELHIIPIPLDKNGLPLKKVTLQYGPGTLRGALEEMLRGTGYEVSMQQELRLGRRLNLQNVSISEAIPALLNSHPDPVRWFVSMGKVNVQSTAEIQQARGAVEQALTKMVTLDLREVPIRLALEELFQTAKVSYSLDNSVSGIVTIKVVDKPAREVLDELLKKADSPLEFVIENGAIYVRRQR